MADYSSRKVTIIRVILFAALGAILFGYGVGLEGTERMVWTGIGIFDLIYAGVISYPLWRKKH